MLTQEALHDLFELLAECSTVNFADFALSTRRIDNLYRVIDVAGVSSISTAGMLLYAVWRLPAGDDDRPVCWRFPN